MVESSQPRPQVNDPRTLARQCQLDLCKRAVEENTVVYFGTGCGKTHIAVLVMYELAHSFRRPSPNICVFLAPTARLVRQQAMVIEECTDFKVRSYYGSSKQLTNHHEWNREIEETEVLVMTPQILLYNLRHCFVRMELITLLIFDECHHAQQQKRHPYAQIMKEFYKINSPKTPRIFGMTASPIISKGGSNQSMYPKCINSLESLLDAKVCSVDGRLELESVIASPDIIAYWYGPVIHAESSLTLSYQRKLDRIKKQCMHMLHEKICDLKECQKLMELVLKMHNNVAFCLENVGLYGAIRAVQILLTSEGSDLSDMKQDDDTSNIRLTNVYLNSAYAVLSHNVLEDNIGSNHFAPETLEEPFFSKKLSVLIGVLSEYRHIENMKCIIFVKRILVARSLAYLLGSLKSLDFWKCESLVGSHSGLRNMSRKQMKTIIKKFHAGEINLLVATNVAEEGLDIQTCCLVVRYDVPETVASFIQSRGQARMQSSKYVFLLERGNQRDQKLLDNFRYGEAIMNMEVTCRTSSDTFDKLEETVYKVDSTGASISTGCSISFLHTYCAKLPRDIYFEPIPKFIYSVNFHGTICRTILPPNAPLRQVDSELYSSKDEAKRAACLKACIELHKVGALTDYLLPGVDGEKKKGLTTNCSGTQSTNTNDDCLREELHEMLVPAALKVPWSCTDDNIDMYFYYINLVPIPDDRSYRQFGLFVKAPIPKEAETMEVDLNLAQGRIVRSGFVSLGMITFSREEILLAQDFQEMFLKVILDRSEFSHEFVPLGESAASHQPSSTFYLLLPVKRQICDESMIVDWPTVRRCLSSPVFRHPVVPCERDLCPTSNSLELLNGTFTENEVLYCLVFTPHNKTFYFIDGILHGTNANIPHKSGDTSYAEHYMDEFGIQLSYPEQPLLKAKQVFNLRNLLHYRGQESTVKLEARKLAEHFVEFPPEMCSLKIFGFSKDIGSSLSLLPSLMQWLENLLVAMEMKELFSAAFPEGSGIRADTILTALTTEKCLERYSLERFEVLGDSFLKYVVGCHSFLKYQGLDEGQLTERRSGIVNNSNLYELAVKKKMQVYIRNEIFHPPNFFALGRPCKLLCDVDTESRIHSQRGNDTLEGGSKPTHVKCTKSHRWIHKKTIADVVEALVGAFLVEGGFKAAIAFLRWLGIQVNFEVSDLYSYIEDSKSNLSLSNNIDIDALEKLVDYRFKNKGLLLQAFVHPSYYKHSGGCYQKLEFLGDAVLEYLVTSYLYSAYPDLKPGQITDLRSIAVNNNSFANIAVGRSFHEYLVEDSSSLHEAVNKFKNFVLLPDAERDIAEEPACPKVLGDIVESLIGAMLLDTGFDLNFLWKLMLNLLEPALKFSSLYFNPVRQLVEVCQHYNFDLQFPVPVKHNDGFFVEVEVNAKGNCLTYGAVKNNSRAARRIAAQEALTELKARGFSLKTKSLKEIIRSTTTKEPELIGYNEAPITIENVGADSISSKSTHEPGVENGGTCIEDKNRLGPVDMHQNGISGLIGNGYHLVTNGFAGIQSNKSARSLLSDICSVYYWNHPSYVCCKEEGPSHKRIQKQENYSKRVKMVVRLCVAPSIRVLFNEGFLEFTSKVTIEVEGASTTVLECYGEPKRQKKAAEEQAAVGALWCLEHLGYVNGF